MAACAIVKTSNIYPITEEDIKLILSQYSDANEKATVENFHVHTASNKMLGFLAEYLKVKVHLTNRKVLYLFIKAISRTNKAKADMVKDLKLFDKESMFYEKIQKRIDIPGIKPWSPRYVTALNDAIVFEDINARHFIMRNKFVKFDIAHTLQALATLVRFHACSIIFEENKKKETNYSYRISDDYACLMDKGGYHMSCDWYIQCMMGALGAIKEYSKYNEAELKLIECNWHNVWSAALDLNNSSICTNQRNVVCHRDLWNNNLMFHYRKGDDNELVPDDCLIVDFQGARYQPLTSDVMILICCNVDSKTREINMETFLNFYYEELKKILSNYSINIDEVISSEEFLKSANEQRKCGLVVSACLMPQIWIDDDLTTRIFNDSIQFHEILCKNKGSFIKTMMKNNLDYRQNIMEIFEEIADRYCLKYD